MTPLRRLPVETLCRYGVLLLLATLFLWTRINPNTGDRIYFFGDGTLLVALVEEMLASGDWTADAGRVVSGLALQKEWEDLSSDVPQPGGHYFNLSGYTVLLASACRVFQGLGLDFLSVPAMARLLNLLLQAATLVLLYGIGKRIAGRELGIWAVLFFILLPLAVTEAQYERPETWLAFLAAAMLYASLHFSAHPGLSILAMGIALGFSAAVKPSQLFLLLLPGFLLLQHLLERGRATSVERLRESIALGMALLGSLALAFYINVPFVFDHWGSYVEEVARTGRFFDAPTPLYSADGDGYAAQAVFIAGFFWKTMGIPWCLLVLIGMLLCLTWRHPLLDMPAHFRASLCVPILFLLAFLAGKENFFERFFSATEPMMCLLGALGMYFMRTELSTRAGETAAVFAVPLIGGIILLQPLLLDYRFIEGHIRHNGHHSRIDFQEQLKKDFAGFWIKNVHITYSFSKKIPEKPEKTPRIYHIEDYNQAWTQAHLEHLAANGFVRIARYCSDFSELPPGNHTIYHAPAKSHYLVRVEEWPAAVRADYFVTNCQ